MVDLIKDVVSAPLSTILVVAGITCVGFAIVGRYKNVLRLVAWQRVCFALLGIALFGCVLWDRGYFGGNAPIKYKMFGLGITKGNPTSDYFETVDFIPGKTHDGENELLHLRARKAVDISRGFVGDKHQSRNAPLPDSLQLRASEELMIFTNARFGVIPPGIRVVELFSKGGFWKQKDGESDGVVLTNKSGDEMLSFSYRVP